MKSRATDIDIESAHTPDEIQKRLQSGPPHSYLRDFVYGAIDGSVTTFAIVTGVAGAQLPGGIVLILGLANLLADGFSMAAGNFLANRAERQLVEKAKRMEEWHIQTVPEGEREEIRQIFAAKGFQGHQLEAAVDIITSDRQQWINMMVQEELGLPLEGPTPWRAALTTFAAFVLVGLLPLAAFILNLVWPGAVGDPFLASAGLTAFGFFAVGALKGRWVDQPWYLSGAETLVVGSSAAAISYGIGLLLGNFV